MRCIGFTSFLKRCKKSATKGRLFCINHYNQPLRWLFVIVFVIGTGVVTYYGVFNRDYEPIVVQNINSVLDDIDFKFSIVDFDLTEKDLLRAPKSIHCQGKIGQATMEIKLLRSESIEYEVGSRGKPHSRIVYNSDHIRVPLLTTYYSTINDLEGVIFKFSIPYELVKIFGDDTDFSAQLFLKSEWFPSGIQDYRDGPIEIKIQNVNK